MALVCFVGDVHGQVLHALAALVTCVRAVGPLDAIVQVGDLGAWPDPSRLDAPGLRYADEEPAQLDFMRMLEASGSLASQLRQARERLGGPVLFIRGNHEDQEWLTSLRPFEAVDPFDLFRLVPDGTVLELAGVRAAFLGGVESGAPATRHREEAVASLEGAADVDLLVTHDGPYGVGLGWSGDVQGSRRVATLVERLRPRWHVWGHLHHVNGPRVRGSTVCIGLNILMGPVRANPSRTLEPGCLALLDTATGVVSLVTAPWLTSIGGRDALARALASDTPPAAARLPDPEGDAVLEAYVAECDALSDVLRGLSSGDLARQTNCPPWNLKELVVHIWGSACLIPDTLAERPRGALTISAADYYRREERSEPVYRSRNVERARDAARRHESGLAVVVAMDRAWRATHARLLKSGLSSWVVTDWGAAIRAPEYLATRVLALAAHGLDVAITVGVEPWTTPQALDVCRAILVSLLGAEPPPGLGWDAQALLACGTGRRALDARERDLLGDLSMRFPLLS